MVKLVARSPAEGLLPVSAGHMILSERDLGHVTSISGFSGQAKVLSAALKAAHGMGYPAPNRATGKLGSRCVWFGRCHALLMGPAPDASLAACAAITDQSDAWVVLQLKGAGSEDVLARLTPIDIRAAHFKRGHTALTDLQHMAASITRTDVMSFDIMVMRSMAATLVHDLKTAMSSVAARADAPLI